MTNKFVLSILIVSCLLFGTVEIWSAAIVNSAIFTVWLIWMLRGGYKDAEIGRQEIKIIIAGLCLVGFFFLQAVPIPVIFLKLVSPSSAFLKTFYSIGERSSIESLSLYPYATIIETVKMVSFMMVFSMVMVELRKKEALIWIIRSLVVFGFILAVFAIVQKATWNGKIYWFRELTMGGNAFGPFVNRNHFASFIGMLIPLGLGITLYKHKREKKLLFGFMTVIMTVSLFFSLSRGGIISFFIGTGVFSLFLLQQRFPGRKIWAIGMFIIVVLAYLIYLGADPIIDRFYNTDVTKEERLVVWETTLKACKDFFLTGSGLGTFIHIFPVYSPPTLKAIYDHAHNDYIEFFLEAGTIGTFLFITFIFLIFRKTFSVSTKGRSGIIRTSLIVSVITMAVHSFFDFNLHIHSNLLLIAAVLGMNVAIAGVNEYAVAISDYRKNCLPLLNDNHDGENQGKI